MFGSQFEITSILSLCDCVGDRNPVIASWTTQPWVPKLDQAKILMTESTAVRQIATKWKKRQQTSLFEKTNEQSWKTEPG